MKRKQGAGKGLHGRRPNQRSTPDQGNAQSRQDREGNNPTPRARGEFSNNRNRNSSYGIMENLEVTPRENTRVPSSDDPFPQTYNSVDDTVGPVYPFEVPAHLIMTGRYSDSPLHEYEIIFKNLFTAW